MKEFLEYAKSKGVEEIDVDMLCLLSDFFKETKSKQFYLQGVVASVLCVKKPYNNSLTLGEKYEVIKEHEAYFTIKNDLGKEENYCIELLKKL